MDPLGSAIRGLLTTHQLQDIGIYEPILGMDTAICQIMYPSKGPAMYPFQHFLI